MLPLEKPISAADHDGDRGGHDGEHTLGFLVASNHLSNTTLQTTLLLLPPHPELERGELLENSLLKHILAQNSTAQGYRFHPILQINYFKERENSFDNF